MMRRGGAGTFTRTETLLLAQSYEPIKLIPFLARQHLRPGQLPVPVLRQAHVALRAHLRPRRSPSSGRQDHLDQHRVLLLRLQPPQGQPHAHPGGDAPQVAPRPAEVGAITDRSRFRRVRGSRSNLPSPRTLAYQREAPLSRARPQDARDRLRHSSAPPRSSPGLWSNGKTLLPQSSDEGSIPSRSTLPSGIV